MEMFNLISGVCSIIGLFLTIFLTSKLVKINASLSVKKDTIENNKMRDNNMIVGGNYNDSEYK